jgi:hypothetical protein
MSPLPNAWPTPGAPGWNPVVEENIQAAYDLAESAAATSSSAVPGVVQVDSFTGATDAAKMTAALTYAAAQTNVPWLQLPARTFNTGSTSFDMFTGMKICGAGLDVGTKNQEISAGKPVIGKWQTTCGNLGSSLLRSTTEMFGINIAGISFHGGTNSQLFRSTANLYSCQFHNLTVFGGKHAFGAPSEKFLMTQAVFSGHWTVQSFSDQQFTMGGSDCSLWMFGYLNIGGVADGGGKPMMALDSLSKTNAGYMYFTCDSNWVGLRVTGSQSSISYYGGAYEGRSQGDPSLWPVIDIVSGINTFYSPYIAQVADTGGNANGAIHQSGGQLTIYSPFYKRSTAVTAAFPMLYQTGGTARVYHPVCTIVGEQARIRWSTGVTDTIALHSNGATA